MDTKQKLAALRESLKKQGLAGYIQPLSDEYMSEYPPACNRRVEWLSGFSGSAGTVVVLANKAAFLTDGRYTLQAKNELDGALFEQHNSGELSPESWIATEINQGDHIGYDAKLYTKSMLSRLQSALEKKGGQPVPVANLVDAVWKDRPAPPATPLFIHDVKYSGEAPPARRTRMAEELSADAVVLTTPDSVCWLLGIRARDVENTPLALAHAILHKNSDVDLFISPARVDAAVRAHMGAGVTLHEPAALESALKKLGAKKLRVLCDPGAVPVWFTQILSESGALVIEGRDPCVLAKATKNPAELAGMKNAHIRDGAAIAKCLCWIDTEATKGKLTETDIAEKLLGFRAEQTLFVEPSFPTIAGSGPNGAIVHYRATPKSSRTLKSGELLLLDSGGQYLDGTTDITRTLPIGKPSEEHKKHFTLVLKGHIAIATARFPEGTAGSQLDGLARQFLWQEGLDYDHGTGHGVGQFLGVHEGPQRIGKRGGDAALKSGMILSNEPGYYKTGEYGIRIENLVVVTPADAKGFLQFATITCAPLDTRLVDTIMLAPQEKAWLNHYHAWVFEKLSAAMNEAERAWLKERCAAI